MPCQKDDDGIMNILLSARLNIQFAFFVAIRMNGAETETVISILVVDLLMQLWMTLQIVKMKSKVAKVQNEIVEKTLKIVHFL